MALSTATRNLKFMQRAAARSTPSTSQSTSTLPSQPATQPVQSQSETSGVGESSSSIVTDEGLKWYLPSRRVPLPNRQKEVGEEEDVGVVYENSYLPFLSSVVPGLGESSSSKAGGGRMAFGGFGAVKVDEEIGGDEDGEEVDTGRGESARKSSNVERRERERDVRRDKPKSSYPRSERKDRSPNNAPASHPTRKSPPPESAHLQPRTFIRPAGFSPPPERVTKQQPPKKLSTADKLRQITSAHRANGSSIHRPIEVEGDVKPELNQITSPTTTKKRKQPEPHHHTSASKKSASESVIVVKQEDGGGLDERERLLKARRRREKKAKARKSGGIEEAV